MQTGLGSLTTREFPSRRVTLPSAVFVVLVVAWEFGAPAAGIESYVLPTPSEIVASLLTAYPTILGQLRHTLEAFALAFSLTVVSGYLLAVMMAQSTVVETTLYPYVIVAKSIPVITLLPVFILWLGFGFPSIVTISYLISVFAMVVNSLSGFKSTDDELVEVVRSFSGSRLHVFRHVHLYSALPSVFAGIKICVILTFTGVIVGEFLVGTEGIGYLIMAYNNSFSSSAMFASVLVVSITELILFAFVVVVERLVVTWEFGNRGTL